jgi:hypothetical protein
MLRSRRTLRLVFVLALTLVMVAPGAINRAYARPTDQDKAQVSAVIARAPGDDGLLIYTIKVANRGDGFASHATVTVPFDATMLRLADVTFAGAGGWVTSIDTGSFQFRTERLGSGGGTTIATARFSRLSSAPASAMLTERLTVAWGDATGGGRARSNLPMNLTMAQPYPALTHRHVDAKHYFSSTIFVPGEQVVFWYNNPRGEAVETEVHHGVIVTATSTDRDNPGESYASADANGAIDLRFDTHGLAAGSYTMVARGEISGFTAIGPCDLP